MKLKIFFFIILLLLPGAFAQTTSETVSVGIYLLNLGRFDIATGTFTADFYLSLQCPTECSISDFEFSNGRAISVDTLLDTPEEKFYRVQASLNSPIDLKEFPFDRQQLQIILEDKTKTTDLQIYIAKTEESGIDQSLSFAGWNIDGWTAEIREHYYPVYDETYSQYVYTIDISRLFLSSFLKTFLPVFFIIIVVLCTYIIDPDKVAQRITMVSSGLVAAVMFHVSINNQIPPVGYLTFADKFMILTYLVLLISFIIAIILLELLEKKKIHLAEKVHRATEYSMFVIVPLLYICLFLFF